MAHGIKKESTLLNLALAMLNTKMPITKEEVRLSVEGFKGYEKGTAFDKTFELAKSALRELGLRVVTFGTDGPGDEVGYRIVVPDESTQSLALTPTQVALLNIASTQWSAAAPRRDIASAWVKLRVLSSGDADGAILGGSFLPDAVSMSTDNDAAYEKLFDALSNSRAVKFSYRAASSGQTTVRVLEPWRIAARNTGWYVVGRDRDRDAPRVFHFERIVGKVSLVGQPQAYELPPRNVIDEAAQAITARNSSVAHLIIDHGRAGELRNRATKVDRHCETTDRVEISYTHLEPTARLIAGYADAIEVESPNELRDRVLALLRSAAVLNGEDSHG